MVEHSDPMADAQHRDDLLGFFRIEQADLDVLAKLREPLERHADQLVDEFYQHLLRFTETQELLRDQPVRERLLESQRRYLMSLVEPKIDSDYIKQRIEIGNTHERVGLDTRWYLGAYALYFSLLAPIVRQSFSHDPILMERLLIALQKRLVFDSEIAIRQYIERREQQLRILNTELQAAGRTLTREVEEANFDLLRTQERARAAEQLASVGTLISGLAHEVGTPMGVIRGHAEALESNVEGERARWRLNMILEQIDRITGIIQSLLNMARPRQSVRTSVDLEEIVRTTLGFLTEKLKRRQVRAETEVREVAALVGDPERLQQVLLNLFINAIDAMPDGGDLRIALDVVGKDAVVRITDTGVGVPPEQLDDIFEPFHTSKAAGRGNGLGLVVVKGILEEHGGRIDVDSEPGKGSEFVIWLPIDSRCRTS